MFVFDAAPTLPSLRLTVVSASSIRVQWDVSVFLPSCFITCHDAGQLDIHVHVVV